MQGSKHGGKYDNFVVAIYARVHEIEKMRDRSWLEASWNAIAAQLKVDKLYIETFRDGVILDDNHLVSVKSFFEERGIRTAAGIAMTVDEPDRFKTPCYTDPSDRALVKRIMELSARHFDEIILDDFFFTCTKTDSDIAAKGDRSWTEFRLDLMRKASRELVLEPARSVNPNAKITIKYPNWYEHFHGLGFDLELQPAMFDGIYTGTETRNHEYNAQHLQEYEGYAIMRYFENIAPGRNGGGWVDTGGMRTIDRYAEQLWLTMFAKAREITLFDYSQLIRPIQPNHRAQWQGMGTSFDFDAMVRPHLKTDGSYSESLTVARAAALALELAETAVAKIGDPTGIATYRPPHATGEEFLHNYLGGIGIPMDIRPEFPTDADSMLLTEAAKRDPDIVAKIEAQLRIGKRITITSGLAAALWDRGLDRIVEWRQDGKKVLTDEFYHWGRVYKADRPILLPQVEYYTNDSWELIGAHANGHPLLMENAYSKGVILCLAVPDDAADLNHLPSEVLSRLRAAIMKTHWVRFNGPSRIALMTYDNNTFIVESFRDEPAEIEMITGLGFKSIRDLLTGEAIDVRIEETPGRRWGAKESRHTFPVALKAHSFRVFEALQ
jgi:hypothetical protein